MVSISIQIYFYIRCRCTQAQAPTSLIMSFLRSFENWPMISYFTPAAHPHVKRYYTFNTEFIVIDSEHWLSIQTRGKKAHNERMCVTFENNWLGNRLFPVERFSEIQFCLCAILLDNFRSSLPALWFLNHIKSHHITRTLACSRSHLSTLHMHTKLYGLTPLYMQIMWLCTCCDR